jgi:hypothetical protein
MFVQRLRRFLKSVEGRMNNRELKRVRLNTGLSRQFEAVAFEHALLKDQLDKFGPKFVAKYNTHVFSQTYEDAAIAEIFSRIGADKKTFIEIGVENGSENTTRLLLALGWKGLWIEGNGSHCETIRRSFGGEIASGQLRIIHSLAEPDNVQSLIDSAKLGPVVDFLSVDVDQHTSHLFRAITTRSRAACIEYNAHFPPTIEYEVPYRKGVVWDGGSKWWGASLMKLASVAAKKNMALVGCDLLGVNAYFVDRVLTGDLFPHPFTAEYHYQPPRHAFVRGRTGTY